MDQGGPRKRIAALKSSSTKIQKGGDLKGYMWNKLTNVFVESIAFVESSQVFLYHVIP